MPESRTRPEYSITLSIVGVLVAIGVPSLRRGQLALGWACMVLAVAVGAWAISVLLRGRR